MYANMTEIMMFHTRLNIAFRLGCSGVLKESLLNQMIIKPTKAKIQIPSKSHSRDPGLRESDSQNTSKERVDREEHDQQVGGYPIKYIFFNHDATHIDNVDGLERVKLDVKDSVEALPQSPVEAKSRDAIAEQNRVQKLASLGYSPGQQHARETKNSVQQACQHGHRFFDGTNR